LHRDDSGSCDPLLPIRPLLITISFAVTSLLIAFLFGLFPRILGLLETIRDAAVIMLLLFGVLTVWSLPFEVLSAHLEEDSARVRNIPARPFFLPGHELIAALGEIEPTHVRH
jgi:hypothetical protein